MVSANCSLESPKSPDSVLLGQNSYLKLFLNRDLSSLREEPLRLESKINELKKSKVRTLSQQYQIIIKSREVLEDTLPGIKELSKEINVELKNKISQVDEELDSFKNKWSLLSESKRKLDIVRKHGNQLQDLCDLPKLFADLIASKDYSGALNLVHRIRELNMKFNEKSHLITNSETTHLLAVVKSEMEVGLEKMVSELICSLRSSSLKLDDCLHYLDLLSQTKLFTSDQLKFLFLSCRLDNFETHFKKDENKFILQDTSSEECGRFLKNALDSALNFSTEIFSLYPAAFPIPVTSIPECNHDFENLTLNPSSKESSHNLLYSLMHSKVILPLLDLFKKEMPKITQTSSLSSLINQFMTTGSSLGKLGLDIRQLFIPSFEDCILSAFSFHFTKALNDLKHSLNPSSHRTRQQLLTLSEKAKTYKKSGPENTQDSPFRRYIDKDFSPPLSISLFPALAQYLNDILHQFNFLRNLAVLTLSNRLLKVLIDNLKGVGQHLLTISPDYDPTKGTAPKTSMVTPFHQAWKFLVETLFLTTLVPYLSSVMILAIFGSTHSFLPPNKRGSILEDMEKLVAMKDFRSIFPI